MQKTTVFSHLRPLWSGFNRGSWHAALATVVLVFFLGFFTIKALNNSPAKPILVDASNLTASESQSLLAVVQTFGDVRFFEANLHQIHAQVMGLSWVEDAQVSRDWSQGIVVSVTPRQAIANFGSDELLDANGAVFAPANLDDLMNPNLVTLHGTPEEAVDIMHKLAYINELFLPLGLLVGDLMVTPRQTWVIRFDNGLRIVVDRENTNTKLYHVSAVLTERYASSIHKIQSIDLRYKNGFAIDWKKPQRPKNDK